MSPQDQDIAEVWRRTVAALATNDTVSAQQLAFVRLARPLGLIDGNVLLAVGNDFTKDFLETRVRAEVTRALSDAIGADTRIAVTVDPSLESAALDVPPTTETNRARADEARDDARQTDYSAHRAATTKRAPV